MHMDRLERMVLAERQVAVAVLAAGGEADIPDIAAEMARLDHEINSEPSTTSAASILRELGVA